MGCPAARRLGVVHPRGDFHTRACPIGNLLCPEVWVAGKERIAQATGMLPNTQIAKTVGGRRLTCGAREP
jgi:hypothetical protein